jgi:hypothetical protein
MQLCVPAGIMYTCLPKPDLPFERRRCDMNIPYRIFIFYLNILILLFFKLRNRLGLAKSQSISGVQSASCNVSLILGGCTILNPVPSLIPVLLLNVDRVGDDA